MWRKDLTDTINATNEQLGIAVHWEHRSFKKQGIDREPTIHIGAVANALERKGILTERGNINREIIKNLANSLFLLPYTLLTNFEQISTISEKELKEVLGQFDTNSLVTALMGASPETNSFCERLSPDIDFEMARKNIGRIRIETVEDMQNQIVSMINLQAVGGEI